MWERVERAELKRRARQRGDRAAGPPPQPSLPAGTDLLPQIKHIVVLMMENHSYDNYLGMLHGRGDGFPLGADGKPEVSNPDTAGEPVRAHHLPSDGPAPRRAVAELACHPSPVGRGQARRVRDQHPGGRSPPPATSTPPMPGAGAAVGMGYWTEDDLPFYYGLARTFPLADRWFSSCLGPTFPNRRFLIAGTAHGLIDDAPYGPARLPARRDHLRPAEQARHFLGQLPSRRPPASPGCRSYARHKRRMARRRLLSAGQVVPRGDQRGPEGPAVHGRRFPGRHRPVHAARAQHRPVLRGRR